MNSRLILPNIIRFVLLVIIQILVLHQLILHNLINPYIYPLFILMLPFRTPHWLMLLLAVLLGMFIEMFTYTYGIHIAALLVVAFMRPWLISILSPRNTVSNVPFPGLRYLGFKFFVSYISISILVHHSILFFLDAFGSEHFIDVFLRILFSSLISIILILLYEYLFISQKEK